MQFYSNGILRNEENNYRKKTSLSPKNNDVLFFKNGGSLPQNTLVNTSTSSQTGQKEITRLSFWDFFIDELCCWRIPRIVNQNFFQKSLNEQKQNETELIHTTPLHTKQHVKSFQNDKSRIEEAKPFSSSSSPTSSFPSSFSTIVNTTSPSVLFDTIPKSQIRDLFRIPARLEKCLSVGFLICLECQLYEMTLMPLQALIAARQLILLGFHHLHLAGGETYDKIKSYILYGLHYLWERLVPSHVQLIISKYKDHILVKTPLVLGTGLRTVFSMRFWSQQQQNNKTLLGQYKTQSASNCSKSSSMIPSFWDTSDDFFYQQNNDDCYSYRQMNNNDPSFRDTLTFISKSDTSEFSFVPLRLHSEVIDKSERIIMHQNNDDNHTDTEHNQTKFQQNNDLRHSNQDDINNHILAYTNFKSLSLEPSHPLTVLSPSIAADDRQQHHQDSNKLCRASSHHHHHHNVSKQDQQQQVNNTTHSTESIIDEPSNDDTTTKSPSIKTNSKIGLPSSLLLTPTQACDLTRIIILIAGVWLFNTFVDISEVYHFIRGQSLMKLYVIFNMLEIFERLWRSLGRDALDALMRNILSLPIVKQPCDSYSEVLNKSNQQNQVKSRLQTPETSLSTSSIISQSLPINVNNNTIKGNITNGPIKTPIATLFEPHRNVLSEISSARPNISRKTTTNIFRPPRLYPISVAINSMAEHSRQNNIFKNFNSDTTNKKKTKTKLTTKIKEDKTKQRWIKKSIKQKEKLRMQYIKKKRKKKNEYQTKIEQNIKEEKTKGEEETKHEDEEDDEQYENEEYQEVKDDEPSEDKEIQINETKQEVYQDDGNDEKETEEDKEKDPLKKKKKKKKN